MLRLAIVLLCVLAFRTDARPSSFSQAPVAGVGSARTEIYPDSAAGMQAQMDGMIRLIKSPDQSAFLAELDALAIPRVNEWIAANFPTYAATQFQQDYTKAFGGYRSHVWWVMGNFATKPDFKLMVEASELPAPLAASGFEALMPRPSGTIKIENYRFSPLSSTPPSWVSSFVYMDGRFRFVGGTYPFWDEKLTSMRGPMAIPAKQVGELTVQAVPFEVDPHTPGVVSVIVLDVQIGGNGKAHAFSVRSGDPKYVKRAEDYVRDWTFFPMATSYPLNVVFFNTK